MRTLIERVRAARERRRAIRALRGYPAEVLRDIGITRDEIRDYVTGRGRFAPNPARPSAEIIPFPCPARPAGRCCAA
ncbi:DUF1127 domain-containing protein [Psychromarinibacter sp. C21-152]|uniref:DUF1127 domain-containing protein n=1 Tax=Psychromarinibacter sediminicola TaxID=3033385 RepID=A0AAE3NKA1_9RHOB|nr:DUF1127 domain-containing protein [Psychromarinibacter sediminicola]MDF0599433.1 DUF1127 domain-containing protein [Psychromarinibacter sediminicola]